MRSWKVGRFAGIDVYIHWTFFLLIGWLVITQIDRGILVALQQVALIGTLFFCVVLHEYGHALTARRFGVATRDITLLPIGGLARLERMPEKPLHELLVAIAGPAVNVVIAAAIFVCTTPFLGVRGLLSPTGFIQQIFLMNLFLVVFNMLPAFPMDGGRVLRATLALFMNYGVATRIAAFTGQLMAGIFVVAAFVIPNPFLALIGVFIFFGAGAEAGQVALRERMRTAAVREVMIRRFKAIPDYLSIGSIAHRLIADSQPDYPVLHNGGLCGMLRRADLEAALTRGDLHLRAGELKRMDYPTVYESDSLMDTLQNADAGGIVPVLGARGLVGLLDLRRFNRPPNAEPVVAEIVSAPGSDQ